MWQESFWKYSLFLAGALLGAVPLEAQQPSVQVTAQVVAAESAAAPVMLEDLVGEALTSNPGVQAALRRVEARRRRVPQA